MISKNSEHAIQLKLCSSKLANPCAQDFGDSKVLILTDGWKTASYEMFHTLCPTHYQTGAGFRLNLAINRIWNLIMKFCSSEQQNHFRNRCWAVLNFRISPVNRFIDSLLLLQLIDSHNNLNGIFQTTIIPSSAACQSSISLGVHTRRTSCSEAFIMHTPANIYGMHAVYSVVLDGC